MSRVDFKRKILAFMDKTFKHPFEILVISAPSGTGKSTLNNRFLSKNKNFQLSVSYTTRGKRKGDTDGVDYHFINVDSFEQQIRSQRMLEYAKVFHNYYGTSLDEIHRIKTMGKVPLLEIDVQGWQQIQQKISNCLAIFILPPSIRELWQRLTIRDSDSRQVQIDRIISAKNELLKAKNYDFFIINRHLEDSLKEMESIAFKKESSLSYEDGLQHTNALLDEYKDEWFLHILDEKQKYDQQNN